MAARSGNHRMTTQTSVPALQRFMRLVLAEPALQAKLGECGTPEAYLSAVLAIGLEHGIVLERDGLPDAIRPDPLGLSRWGPAPIALDGWPPRCFLPARSVPGPSGPSFDWAWFGARPLTDPFYEDAVRQASYLPFNQMFRIRTSIDSLVAGADGEEARYPAGFIFHGSRCGSTLLARMLMAVPDCAVASEPEPLDAVVQWAQNGGVPKQAGIAALRAIAAALGRDRQQDGERPFFIKLDSWHVQALPLFREAFPDVPWIFLYREPVEVMVSQMALPGIHAVPGLLSARLFAIAGGESMPPAEYCARVLCCIYRAAEHHLALGGGMLVNYSELPSAAMDRIPAHFGFRPDEAALAAMSRAATDHAKHPGQAFGGDRSAKRTAATDSIKAATEAYVEPAYARLEALRNQGRHSPSLPAMPAAS